MNTKLHRRLLKSRFRPLASGISLAAVVTPLFIGASANAQITWDAGASPDLDWSTATNWAGDVGPTGADAVQINTIGTAALGTVTNIVSANTSIASLAFLTAGGNSTAQTTQIAADQTLTISGATAGALTVGQNAVSATFSSAAFTGSGSLAVTGGTSASINVGAGTMSTQGTNIQQVLDMSGLANFSANIGNFNIGTGQRNAGNVSLAASNSITATTILVGSGTGTGSGSSTLSFGTTNTINANTITIATGRYNGTVQFQPSLTNATVSFADRAGTGATAINIGTQDLNASSSVTGVLDLSGGTATGSLSTVTIGRSALTGGAGSGTGTLTFGAGNLAAATVNIGNGNSGTNAGSTGTGNFNMTVGAGTFTATTVNLGRQLNTGATVLNNAIANFNQNGGTAILTTLTIGDRTAVTTGANVTATYNLAGGTLRAQTIQAGGNGTGGGTVTRNFNWTAGTIQNLNSSTDLTIGSGLSLALSGAGEKAFAVDNGRVITVNGNLTGTGGFTKTGLGSLALSGTNTYIGGTVVNQGGVTFSSTFTMAGSNGFSLSGAASPSAGSDYGFISATGGTFSYGGDLVLTFSGTAVSGASYNLFDINGATLGGGSFSNVSIGGSYTAGLVNNSGVWSGSDGGFDFTFTESTGDLLISAVPEPSAFALLAGIAGMGCVGLRRRRRA